MIVSMVRIFLDGDFSIHIPTQQFEDKKLISHRLNVYMTTALKSYRRQF